MLDMQWVVEQMNHASPVESGQAVRSTADTQQIAKSLFVRLTLGAALGVAMMRLFARG